MPVRSLFVRGAFVCVLVLCAAAGTWLVVHGDKRIYERRVDLVLRPSPKLDPSTYANAQATIQREDDGVELTLRRILASPAFLARVRAQASPGSDGRSYTARMILRPATEVIEVRLRGPDRAQLRILDHATRRLANAEAGRRFARIYVLNWLSSSESSTPVSPKTRQNEELAGVLALVVGLAILGMERRMRRTGALGAPSVRPG